MERENRRLNRKRTKGDIWMIEKGPDAIKGNRIYFLDNLRTFMIFLVVLYHAGLVYEYTGIVAFF